MFIRITIVVGSFALALGLFSGCASYNVPGAAADLRSFGASASLTESQRKQMTDYDIKKVLQLKPLAQLPTSLAVARVQGSGYSSYTLQSYGHGAYSVITTRDVEKDEHFEKIAGLPMITGVAPINRLLLPEHLESDRDLRQVAAALHADMLLVYTLDTNFYIGDTTSPLDVITLGFLPTREARVITSASAVLLDTRNGYVYGTAEASAENKQIANQWTTSEAVDQTRRKTEAEAFDKLVDAFVVTWHGVVNQAIKASSASVSPADGGEVSGSRYETVGP